MKVQILKPVKYNTAVLLNIITIILRKDSDEGTFKLLTSLVINWINDNLSKSITCV